MPQRYPYFNPELSREKEEQNSVALSEVSELLDDPALEREIHAGNVTLAMIRPTVGPDANVLSLPDLEAADHIEEMIVNLGVMAKFSFQFTPNAVEEFYSGDPKESMSKGVARDPESYDSRWLEFVDFMASGPTTALLLHSYDGDAIPLWRAHLGHWNIDEVRDATTIRGSFGVNKYNNLVHGSDSIDSVFKELNIIRHNLSSQADFSYE